MADSTEEIIGGIGVTITGDYSSLQASYSQAQSDAAAAGEAVADAFNSGVESVSDAGEVVSDALSGIGDAADEADGSLGEFSDSAGEAGEAAETAGSQLAEMAEQLTAVGEALVITEGLTELGSEALGAADSITKASIALTTITGSGDQAHETIEGLEQLGMSDGLAMPSLLSAATRMQAILGPGADVATELGVIANGAAVMGTDIETAATKFDQMATAGTASARTLTSLGLSLQSLTDAFNAVQTGSVATTTDVAAMFKALDQSDRITVLNQALSGLGGTAQQVAEQTFGGQWQQLANAWEGIMVQVGQAILPVVSDILALTKTEIVPFIQEVVGAFTALPEPVKDVAVAIGLAAAAIIPLTGALAALGLGVSGLQTLIPAVTGLFGGMGEAAEVAAPEIAGVGIAAEAAEGTIGALGISTVAAGGLIAALAVGVGVAAVVGFQKWQDSMNAAKSTLTGISDNDLQQFLNGIATVSQGTGNAGTATEQWEAKLVTLKEALDNGTISAKQYETAVKAIEAAQDSLAKQNLADSLTAITGGLKLMVDQTQKATDQQTLLNQVLSDAQTKFQQVSAGYQAGTSTAEQYIAAQKSVQTATEAVTTAQTAATNAAMNTAIEQAKVDQDDQIAIQTAVEYADSLNTNVEAQKQMLTALQNVASAIPPTVAAFAGLDGTITALQSAMPGFGVIVSALSTGPLVGLQNALDEAKGKVANLAAQMADGANVGQQYEKALTQQLNAQIALDQETAILATGLQGATDTISLATDAVAAAQAKVDDLTTAFQGGLATYSQVQSAQKALTTAQTELNTAVGQSNPLLQAQTTAQTNLAPAVNTATTAINAQVTSLQSDLGVLQSVASELNAVQTDLANAMGGAAGALQVQTGYKNSYIPSAGGALGTVASAAQLSSELFGSGFLTADPAAQKSYEQTLYNAGYTPQAIAKALGAPLSQVLSDLSLTAAQASSTQSQVAASSGSTSTTSSTVASVTTDTSTASTASTAVASTASGSGTSAVDGGSYPAVTAHQADGEIWAVTTTGPGGTTGSVSTSGTTDVTEQISSVVNSTNDTSSSALQAVASAVGGAVQVFQGQSGSLGSISVSLQQTAESTAQVATAISGLVQRIGSGGTSSSSPTATGGGGTAYSVGPASTYSGSGNPLGNAAPIANTPVNTIPGYNPFGGTSSPGPTTAPQVTVNVDARGSVGLNTAAMSAQISAVVANALVGQLRSAGARF